MKRIGLFVVFLLTLAATQAQTWTKVNGRWQYQFLKLDSTFTPPLDTLVSAPVGSVAVKNDIPYFKNTAGHWVTLVGVSTNIATAALTATGNYTQNWNNKQFYVDSASRFYMISRGTFINKTRMSMAFEPSSPFPLNLSYGATNAAGTTDTASESIAFLVDGMSFSANNGTKSANIQVRTVNPTSPSYVLIKGDTVRMQAIPHAGAPDSVLAVSTFDPLTNTNALYKYPASGFTTTPALPFNSIQFNNAGSFGGTSDYTWNNSTKEQRIIGASGNLTLGGGYINSGNNVKIYATDSVSISTSAVDSADTIVGVVNPDVNGARKLVHMPRANLFTANNGLTKTGNTVQLGGALTQATTITSGNTAYNINLNGITTSSAPPLFKASVTGNGTAIKAISKTGIALIGSDTANGTGLYAESVGSLGSPGSGTAAQFSTGTGVSAYGFAQSTGTSFYGISGSGLSYYGTSSLSVFNMESNNATYPVSGVHTIGTFSKLNQGQFFGAPGAGFGSSIDYGLTADNGTSSGVTRTALKFITKWATATDASRSAAWELQLVNNASLARKLRVDPDGTLTLDRYATSNGGTAVYGLGVDNTGKVITTTASGVSASNGLTAVGTDIQLGGTITGVTTINSTGSSSNRIVVSGTSSTAWAPFYVNDNGTGAAFMGLQSNVGGRAIIGQNFASGGTAIAGISSNGAAITAAEVGTGVGISSSATEGTPLTLSSDKSNGNATNTVLQITRNNGTPATGASAGMGADILVKLEDGSSSGTTLNTGKISNYWTSVTSGQEKSALDFWTINGGYFSSKFSIRDTGQLQAYRYGTGNFATTDTSYPSAVFGPDGKIYARRGDAGGAATLEQVLTAGSTLTTDHLVNYGATNYKEKASIAATDDFYHSFEPGNLLTQWVSFIGGGAGSTNDSMFIQFDQNNANLLLGNVTYSADVATSLNVGQGGTSIGSVARGASGFGTGRSSTIASNAGFAYLYAQNSVSMTKSMQAKVDSALFTVDQTANTNNVIETQSEYYRRYIGGAGANGIGGAINYRVADIATADTAARVEWGWTNATTKSSFYNIWTQNASSNSAKVLELKGTGQLQLPKYGAGTFTGTTATYPAFDASGNVIEYSKVKFVQTATVSVIANDVETTLTGSGTGSLTIPANSMAVGKHYRLTVRGTYGTDASNPAQQNWRVYLGGTVILASGNAGLGTNKTDKIFVTQVDITCRTTGSSGTVMATGMFNTEDGPGAKGFPPTTTTINTTTNLTLDFTTDLTDGSAGNNMKVYTLVLEEI